MWFNRSQLHSLSQWIVYLFECEIKKAYYEHKKSNTKSKQSEQGSIYTYLRQHYKQNQKLRQLIQKVIVQYFLFDETPRTENYKNKRNFLVTKCMDRLEDEFDKHQYLIQYSWYHQHITNETYKIFEKVAEVLFRQYNEWCLDRKIEQQKQKQQRQKQKKIAKRKKRKEKKHKGAQDQQQNQPHQQLQSSKKEQQSYFEGQKKQKVSIQRTEQNEYEQLCIQEQKGQMTKQQTETKCQKQAMTEQIVETHKKQNEKKNKNKNKHKNGCKVKEQTPKVSLQAISNNKKIIRQRINQYYQFLANQLTQTAAVFDKYRKVVFNVVYHFFQQQIFCQNLYQKQQQDKFEGKQQEQDKQWRLQIYGSASAGFSLRNSDIDIVLLTNSRMMTLSQIFSKLKLQKWIRNYKFIQAQIPIITFNVSLNDSCTQITKLSTKQLKKIQNQLFRVDLTLAPINQPHSGIQNSKHLKQIYDEYPYIRNICILLKQYLRVRGLNKPYTGGINSYVLIILIHTILTGGKTISTKTVSSNPDAYRMIKQISDYMEHQFRVFETVIGCKKDCLTIPDKSIHLNIVNPKNGKLLKTSAFLIHKIIEQLTKLRQFQQTAQKMMLQMNVNEKRNMKNYFIQEFTQFIYGDQLQL